MSAAKTPFDQLLADMGPFVTFSFPAPARVWSTNTDRNLHHYERANLIKAWHAATKLHYINQVGVGVRQHPAVVQVTLPVPDARKRDPHNFCGTVLKAVIDGMVSAGAWPDDTPEWVGHREPILVKTEKNERGLVTVRLYRKDDQP